MSEPSHTASTPFPSGPLGLHLAFASAGPTLRLVVWIERPPIHAHGVDNPWHVRQVIHPYCLIPSGPPPFLHESQHQEPWPVRPVLVSLPRTAPQEPMPLPGMMDRWLDHNSSARNRAMTTELFQVLGWEVPPASSLHSLLHLVQTWRARFGDGLVGPETVSISHLLTWMQQRLKDGPLIPTTVPVVVPAWSPNPSCSCGHCWIEFPSPVEWRETLGLVPSVSLDELLSQRSKLSQCSFVAERCFGSDGRQGSTSVLQERSPHRFAMFMLEVLTAAADAATSQPGSPQHSATEIAQLHKRRTSCLHAGHAALTPMTAPRDSLQASLKPATPGVTLLTLGVEKSHGAFLPVRELPALKGEAVREVAGEVWTLPGDIALRDWNHLSHTLPSIFSRPELLREGTCLLADAELQALDQHDTKSSAQVHRKWLKEMGLDEEAVKARLPVFTAKRRTEKVMLHIHWDREEQPGQVPAGMNALEHFRFRPSWWLHVGNRDFPLEQGEKWLAQQAGKLLQVGDLLLARADVVDAVEMARARAKVLEKLTVEGMVKWVDVVAVEDQWAVEGPQASSIFGETWQKFLDGLNSGEGLPKLHAPTGLMGTLRPYQERGLSWLSFLASNGFGACLADDMGLGKTVQVLSLLEHRRASGAPGPVLVVCPTSVVSNWTREARRFTPELKVLAHHGHNRTLIKELLDQRLAGADVVITSYALTRRDQALLQTVPWAGVVVDEAHNLKNPDAQQTRAIKAMRAGFRVALTGTPVENHLGELWSILDWLNPGLLGGPTRFGRAFISPMRNGDTTALPRLKRRMNPFVLRRCKDDPGILPDLPDKQEQDVECELTREQRALYGAMAEAAIHGVTGKDGMERKAHVLNALMYLKQICNHPECFKEDQRTQLVQRSGKMQRCMDLLRRSLENGHAALLFTQFRSMGALLQQAVREELQTEALFFHGDLSASQRDAVLESFGRPEGPRVLVLSLKAGGAGLNLTRASTVIHYDRWWNPAVERQATDRAHRMGQTQKVNVYRLITRGTLEERIAVMLERKTALATQVLTQGDDTWITEMDDQALRGFLSLGELDEEELDNVEEEEAA